jgi:hypothetical protein
MAAIMFPIPASVSAPFGQLYAKIIVQISLSEKARNEGEPR